MMTSGTTDTVLPLSKKQKLVCNIVMGVMLVSAGIILALAGAGVIPAGVRSIAIPTLLFAFGIAVLFSAIVAKNALSMWLAGTVLSCGLVSVLELTTSAGYVNLFPIYIAAPGIGSLFAIWFAECKFVQVKSMLFFGGFALMFSFGAAGLCGWGLSGGLAAAFGGLCVIAVTLESYFKKDKDNNA